TGIMQVSAMGGDATALTSLARDETDVHEPSELPGGRGFLYVAHLRSGGPCDLRLWANGQRTSLVKIAAQRPWLRRDASGGHMLYRRSGSKAGLWALPFSLSSLKVTGEPFLVASDGAEPCAGPNGMLVYIAGGSEGSVQLAVIKRNGSVETKL